MPEHRNKTLPRTTQLPESEAEVTKNKWSNLAAKVFRYNHLQSLHKKHKIHIVHGVKVVPELTIQKAERTYSC